MLRSQRSNLDYPGLLEKWLPDPELPPAPSQQVDPCGFAQLPQNPKGGGYYSYGTPARGAGQYGIPGTIRLIEDVARQRNGVPFGVGNISLAKGGRFDPHKSHRNGTDIDIRPLRSDGAGRPADWRQPGYDRAATQALIDAFRASGQVRTIWFNDPAIKGVRPYPKHNDHFHVSVRSTCPKR